MVASEALRVERREMYKTFRVKNFRCFRDLEITDLGRVNLIAGKNNTGKTALMEALFLLTHPLTPQWLSDIQETRGLAASGEDRRDTWRQFFYELNTQRDISLYGKDPTFDGTRRDLFISEHEANPSNLNHMGQYIQHAKQLGLIRENTIDIRGASLLQFAFAVPNSESERSNVYLPSRADMPVYSNIAFDQESGFIPVQGRSETKWIADNFSKLDIHGKLPQLIQSLAVFEPDLTDLRLLSLSSDLTVWGKVSTKQIPLKLMGEGVNRFANLAIAMMAIGPDYLFVDEIENGIHHSVQSKVWQAIGKLARELDIQVFATTHSLEMIRAAYEAFSGQGKLEDLRLHRLDRDSETDDIQAVTYNRRALEALAAFDFDFEVRG